MNNANKDCNCNTIKERKIMIYIIIFFIILLYVALFFIHNIIDIETVRHAQSVKIDYPENTENNNINDSNVNGNNISNSNINYNNIGNSNQINNNEIVGGPNTSTNQTPNGGNTGENDSDNDIIVDNKSRFRVLEGTQEWSELEELSIFNNSHFQDKSIIAPAVRGSYSFTVENYSDTKMKYNIRFTEENDYNINVVYKLKLNGSYIAGDKSQWVKYGDLCKNGLIVNNHTDDIFTIEWRWEDNYNDTQVGEVEGANYKLKVQLNAEDIEH